VIVRTQAHVPHNNTVELTACSMPVLRKKGYYAFLADGADAVAEKNRNIDIFNKAGNINTR
jgi:hypothetical protein